MKIRDRSRPASSSKASVMGLATEASRCTGLGIGATREGTQAGWQRRQDRP